MFRYFDPYERRSTKDHDEKFTGRTGCISRYFFRRSHVRVRSQDNWFHNYKQLN